MINQLLCYIGLMIPVYFHVVAMDQITDQRERKSTKLVRYLVWNIYMGIGIGVRVLINDQPTTQVFMPVYGMLGFLLFLCIFYRGKLWKK